MEDSTAYFSRWLKVWVALLTVVTLVVVVFLIVITNSLASINGNLATAETAVTGAGGDTVTLPDQVESINGSLVAIDEALKPIPGQADQIIGALNPINDKLGTTAASLIDTDASLIDTDGSLKNTSSVLTTILGQAQNINGILVNADDPPDQLGVQNIHRRVAVANGILAPARGDTANITTELVSVNGNLTGICNSLVAGTVLGCSS
ncbi:MAG: hypothetical protein ACRDZ9_02530 [Acidimicrobiales bacterium]